MYMPLYHIPHYMNKLYAACFKCMQFSVTMQTGNNWQGLFHRFKVAGLSHWTPTLSGAEAVYV